MGFERSKPIKHEEEEVDIVVEFVVVVLISSLDFPP